ncbi:Putative NAD(P)-dependent oxidoreductase EC-YbbO [hydrothermal vent metagenome]|uniref:NAD(P)-dependent oxidoreductase EC-YbbO n=1 Tax=hydrothermal vent metagenome TaxID=652676 RepID=A0A3B1BT13_9ZZZZ
MEKSVLVTGCSSGIGFCAAETLKKRGWRVFATARKLEDVPALAQKGFESLQLDLADSGSISSAVNKVLEMTDGKLYAVFNNGAYGLPGAVEDLTRDALREQFEINVFGTQELTNLLIPVMRQNGAGRIVQNSSVLGLVSPPMRGAYNSSKYALEALSDCMRMELHGSGVFVSIIEPGPISTKFRENAYKAFKKYIDPEKSFHREKYVGLVKKLETEGPVASFTLQPDAVVKKLIHALENPRPKIRYYVTFHTHVAGLLRRILPYRLLDVVLKKGG